VHICIIIFLMYVEKQRCFLLKYLWSMDLMPGSAGKFYIYMVVPQKNLSPYMQWTDTGDWSCTPPNFLSLIPNLIATHPLLFVCSISFNIFTATVHAVGCAMSLNFRITLWYFQVMFLATGNSLDGQTLYSMCLQHAAHSHIGTLGMFYKNKQ